jgi:hypothetical protein
MAEVFDPPDLLPLRFSHEADAKEEEMTRLFAELFEKYIRAEERDVNVLGAPHLGSFGLVEQAVKKDALAMYRRGDEPGLRYLYRAWSTRNPKRGLEFLKTYLQIIFPNEWSVEQMWQSKASAYPTGLAKVSDIASPETTHYLTSRIAVEVVAEEILPNEIGQVLLPMRSALGYKFVLKVTVRPRQKIENSLESGSPLNLFGGAMAIAWAEFEGTAGLAPLENQASFFGGAMAAAWVEFAGTAAP